MKKILCTVLSVAILVLSISVSFPVFAQEIEIQQIGNFSEDGMDLVQKYDKGKEFEAITEETDELDDLQFQTARLFVKCSSDFNKMGAEDVVSGFENWHILQFSSPAEAKKAYLYYKEQKKIEAVEPDVALNVEPEDANIFSEYNENANIMPNAANDSVYVTRENFDNDYSKKILGTNEILAYISEHNIKTSKIKVGVLDSGLDYKHELFDKKRVFRTKFNATDTGNKNDEFDNEIAKGHGTSVVSCVLSTSPNTVQVGCYKTLDEKNEEFNTKSSWVLLALLKAYEDKCQVINISFALAPLSEVIKDTFTKMKSDGITIFASSGNDSGLVPYGNPVDLLSTNENVIAVGSTEQHNRCAEFANRGYYLKFFAPGKNVAVAVPNNKYMLRSGTSFSCPFAVGIFATLKSLSSNFSDEKIIDLMQYTCTNVFHTFNHDEVWYGNERYGAGILDAWRAFCEMQKIQLVPDVEFSMETGECSIGDKLILSCADDCEIYYTTDLTPADKENGIRYTQPIIIAEDTVINAIAYDKSGSRGQNKFEYYIAFEMGNENDFVLDEKGTIIGYKGEIRNLEIPETVNGKTVTGLHYDLFSGNCKCGGITQPKNTVTGLKLPKTIEYLEAETYFTEDLEYFVASGLKELICTFCYCKQLVYVNLPKVEKVGDCVFMECRNLREIYLPLCTEIHDMSFDAARPNHLYMPKLKYYYDGLLTDTSVSVLYCPELEKGFTEFDEDATFARNVTFMYQVFLPKLKSIQYNGFAVNDLARAEFSEIESLMQLPIGSHKNNCSLILPLSLKEMDLGYQKGNKKTYTIYGTKGSYAEQWAQENNIEFIELNQETAVYTDVRETCNEYTETLFFDSLGFHKEYQWYGSFDGSTENGIAIDGADKELIHLKDYREYPYYYCVCTSTDIGDGREQVEKIYSKVCKNTDYSSADYSAYNAAVEKANALEREYYKDLTALDAALAVDVSGLTIAEQAIVDAQTKAIEDALIALEFKDADYSAYNVAVEKAKALDKNLYTDTAELDKLLAEDIRGLTILNQDIVDEQTRAIEDALKNLTLKPADYTEYNKAVEQAEAIDRSLYVDLAALDEALAVDVSGKNITEQTEVDSQTQAILNAISALVYKPADYTEVEKAKSEIPEDLSVYTDESVASLRETLNTVDYSLNITEQETVDGYAKAITDAINGLELKPIAPPITDPTEPSEPAKPTQPTNPENPSVPANTQNPDIPKTAGDKLVCIGAASFLPFAGYAIALIRRKRTHIK